jgi:hypothetical protein
VALTPEEQQMLKNKDEILQHMRELQKTLSMYQEAFPENPAFLQGSKKRPKEKKPVAGSTQEQISKDI